MIAAEAAAAAAALQSIDHFVTDSQEAGEKNATLLLHIFSPLSAAIRAVSQLNLTSLHPVFQAKTLDVKCNAFFARKKNSFHCA